MIYKDLNYKNRILSPHKAFVAPNFDKKPVQVRNHWEYVEVWLHKNNAPKEAKLYWGQAKNFYYASQNLDYLSSPLTLYYCILNATKTLLTVKNISYRERHGVGGRIQSGDTTLKNEIVDFSSKGILPQLGIYLKEHQYPNQSFSLYDILYNLPFIHRCFCLSNNLGNELYIPIKKPKMVMHKKLHRGWFCAELTENYSNKHTINKLTPLNFERDPSVEDKYVIRYRKRFKWYYRKPKMNNNMLRFQNYHSDLRQYLQYIYDTNKTSWYIKRCCISGVIDKSVLTLTYAAMHRLSSLSRYNPKRLSRHLELSQKWVLSEFLTSAPIQFIDQISAEITSQNIEVTKTY